MYNIHKKTYTYEYNIYTLKKQTVKFKILALLQKP